MVPCDKRRILIVDDHKEIRDVFRRIVSMGLPDCRVDIVINGAEAVESFRAVHQGILLMDLFMPVMNGEAAFCEIQKLCQAEAWEMPSVVFCTGYDPSDTMTDMIAKNPAHCLLRKPVRNDVLLGAIKDRLGPSGLADKSPPIR